MLKSTISNYLPGHSHNEHTFEVGLSSDICPGNISKRNNNMYELKINKDLRTILNKCKADTDHLDIDMDLSYDSVQNYIDDVDFYFFGYTECGNDRNINQSKEDLDFYSQTIKKTNPKEYARQVESHNELMYEYKETKKHLAELRRLYKKLKNNN